MANITVKFDACIGCRWCAVACPEGVFALRSEVLAVAIAPEKCTLCMKCVGRNGCPERAISVSK
jgi:NAD-dependent dihydropyrimidine dehydrogenase PreA subunit